RTCSSASACHYGEQCDALDGVCASNTCSEAVACGIGSSCSAEETVAEVHEPSLVPGADNLAVFELRDTSGARIFRARLATPELWIADPPAPVLGDASASFEAPTVLVAGARVDLWVARPDGTAIEHATSSDGGASFMLD